MTRPPIVVGQHSVRVLRNGREAFPAMLDAIDAARRRVRVEMYWWQPDALGLRFLDHAVAAARRGVEVRALVDGFGSHALPRAFWAPLQAAGGEAMAFHPLRVAMTSAGVQALVARDHRKILVADDRAFVGGLNFALPWASFADGGEDWRDTALELRGAAASKHLVALFESTWALVTGQQQLEPPATIAWPEEGGLVGIFSNAPAERRGRRIRQAYLWALRRATKSVDITCAYFAPRPLFLRALAGAVRRGVRVRILVPLRSDVEVARQASLPLLRWLEHRGVEVYGYGGSILHAKTAVVDGQWCTIGSHNLDGLSWAWNLECNVVLRNAEIAAQLTALFDDDVCISLRGPPRLGWLERLFPRALGRWYASG